MKWYFSSRTKHEKKINYLSALISQYGHEISFDWTTLGLLKPYYQNKEVPQRILKSISDSDVFVMISDKNGTDMFVELGIAIQNYYEKEVPRIYVVGKYNSRSLMHFHSSINRVKSIEDVFQKECPGILKSKPSLPKFN